MPPGQCGTFAENLAARDPIGEAEQVARSGAPYMLAVQSYSVSFPGLDDPQVALRVGYRTLEGTSDAIRDESCRAFQAQARRFAERYNRRLMSILHQ
jgi:hypothetical protein